MNPSTWDRAKSLLAAAAALPESERERYVLEHCPDPLLRREVLDMLVQKRRSKAAAIKLLKRLLKNTGVSPEVIVTDGLYSYRSAARALGCLDRHEPRRLQDNNRAENSHLPLRGR